MWCIATFSCIGQYFPLLFAGFVGKYGKRKSMMIDSLTYCAGFALMGLAVNAEMLYAAKFILGK